MMKRSPLKELGNLSNSAHFKHQMNPAKCLSKTVEFSDVPMEPAPSKVTSQLDILSVGYRKGDAKDTHCVGTNTTTIPAAPKTPLKISGQASKPGQIKIKVKLDPLIRSNQFRSSLIQLVGQC